MEPNQQNKQLSQIEQRLRNKEQIDRDQRREGRVITGERSVRGKQRNTNRGLMAWTMGGIDRGSWRGGAGESNTEKGRTTVTKQQ